MEFEFATAGRVLFGPGKRREAFLAGRKFGTRCVVVTGRNASRSHWLFEGFKAAGIETVPFPIANEPTLAEVSSGAALAREFTADFVAACGGGSAIDGGKGIAALATNHRPALDYLEVAGQGQPLETKPLPFIAIPTTAGTGAEVTRNAVLSVPEHTLKVSLRHVSMLPSIAIIDPELTYGTPLGITGSSGMDALTQLIEPFVSARANVMTDAFCREGLRLAGAALPRLASGAEDVAARSDMALASLFGGLALANAGLGAVHGLAAPIGGMFPAPHGAICAALLPEVLELHAQIVGKGRGAVEITNRFHELPRLVSGDPAATMNGLIHTIRGLNALFQIPRLGAFGVSAEMIDSVCERAQIASSMKANPFKLETSELRTILEHAI